MLKQNRLKRKPFLHRTQTDIYRCTFTAHSTNNWVRATVCSAPSLIQFALFKAQNLNRWLRRKDCLLWTSISILARSESRFFWSCNNRWVRRFVLDAEWKAQADEAVFTAPIATREGKLQAASLFSSKQFQGICTRRSPQRSATLAAPWSRLRGHAWRAAGPCYQHCHCQVQRTARNSPQTVTASVFWTDTVWEDSEK